MTLQSLLDSGRFPHAVLLIGGTPQQVAQIIDYHKCAPEDIIRVKDEMPPTDTEKKSKKEPPYAYKLDSKWGKTLKDVIGAGNMRPQFGETRLFILDEFDTMRVDCQNTLLKTLEEPHEFNRYVLIAGSKAAILTTILSRVVVVGEEDVKKADDEAAETVAAIMAAAKNRDKARAEYDTAAAFAQVKDRDMLEQVIQGLLQEFAALITTARRPEKLIAATDVLQKYAARTEFNPNVAITITACAVQLQKALHS
ncbi:MAG: hypothetical protein FWD35_05240 [Oscillospiraceae bacterium]|nr:hypothetical protein [Oscillospiraceae bacterium]